MAATTGSVFGGAAGPSSLSQARASELLSQFRLTPATLMAKLNPAWIPAPWLQFLSLKIAQAVARGNCGLLISAPPRHGKSMLSTIATPLWVLENFPDRNVVLATYGDELSTDFSRQIRDYVQLNQSILNVRLREDTQRVNNFLTTKGGGLKAVGLRGAITGRGANVFVLDDYIKEPKEAMSATYLEDLWTWYRTVARTRLEPGAVVIILATRWVADDIHGRIMKKQRETGRRFFEYIEMPAIWEEDEPDMIGRTKGQVLFPQRYNTESILDIKLDLGTRWFNAMFQQKPDDEETKVINWKWFRRITRARFEEMKAAWRSNNHTIKAGRGWDMASLKEAGDYTTGARGVYNKNLDLFVLDSMVHGQFGPNEAETKFTQTLVADITDYGSTFQASMEQEPGSSGKFSVRHFENLAREALKKADLPATSGKVWPHLAVTMGSKQLRAQPWIAAAEAGKFFVVVDDPADLDAVEIEDIRTPWVRTFFEEADKFPEAEHDDQEDALSVNYLQLTGKKSMKTTFGRDSAKDMLRVPEDLGRELNAAGDIIHPAVLGAIGSHTLPSRRSSVTFGRH